MEDVFRRKPRALNGAQGQYIAEVKGMASELYKLYNGLQAKDGDREIEIAKQKLEESVMWAVKYITK